VTTTPSLQLDVPQANELAVKRYVAPTTNLHLDLFLSEDGMRGTVVAAPRWELARWHHVARGGVDVHTVPGAGSTHMTMLNDANAVAVARAVAACLDRIASPAPSDPPPPISQECTQRATLP
jgi:thioesterase domain-containing protein